MRFMDGLVESLYSGKGLYCALFEPVCHKYGLTMTEMLVLLYLAKETGSDTASDIVETLRITKSHVSASVRDLEERGYLHGIHVGHDRRSIHLRLREDAWQIIREGQQAQENFFSVVCRGFTGEEIDGFRRYIRRMNENMVNYLNEQTDRKGVYQA